MPAYLIVTRNGPVKDEESYNRYVSMNMENPPKNVANLKPLVAYGAIQGLEGEAPDGVVVVQFDNAQDARKWYDSPEYQAALPHRLKCGDWQAFIVEGM